MECPRCKSTRIQRGYKDAPILLRLSGRHELLCNNCGLEFKRFKWSATFKRVPSRTRQANKNRRGAPRYKTHLPATIRFIDKKTDNGLSPSASVRGHCQTISSLGMALSFVGSRIDPAEFAKPGRTLQVVLSLPGCAIETVVKTVMHQRIENPDGPAKWFVGASLVQISEADRARLTSYLDKQSRK